MTTVYKLHTVEDSFSYLSCKIDAELSDKLHQCMMSNAPVGSLWREHLHAFKKEPGAPLGDFSVLVGPPFQVLVCLSGIHESPDFSLFTTAHDEFLPIPGLDVPAVAYHCHTIVDAGHPSLTHRPGGFGGPLLLRGRVPAMGFFRIGYGAALYFSEPKEGGFKKWFDKRGLAGVSFVECRFAD